MRPLLCLAIVSLASPAAAQPADLSGVDPCARARSMAAKDAEPAAVLVYLQLCRGAGSDVGRDIARLTRELEGSGYVRLTVEAEPAVAGAVGFVDALGDVPFPLPGSVLVPPGNHRVGAVAPGHHGVAQHVGVPAGAKPTTISFTLEAAGDERPVDAAVDFADEGEAANLTTADDLPEAEHDDLLKARYRRGLEARGGPAERAVDRLRIGGALGMSVGRLGGDGAPTGTRVGLSAALVLAYQIRGPIAFMPELGYAQRGADGATVDYLTIPVRVGYTGGAGAVRFHAAAGPELAIAVTSDLGAADAEVMDLGFSAGGGLRVPAGGGAILIDLYARAGFTDVTDRGSARDRSAAVRAGYLF